MLANNCHKGRVPIPVPRIDVDAAFYQERDAILNLANMKWCLTFRVHDLCQGSQFNEKPGEEVGYPESAI